MAFKNIEIALRLQLAGFTAGLGAASAQVGAFGRQVQDDLGNAPSQAFDKLGKGALLAGGAVLAGFGLAAKATLDFDKQLSDLEAVSGATGDQMERLRSQAIEAGKATSFSASEAAAAQTELAKAGVGLEDILSGGLNGALNLAAAGNLDLATAATYAANAMTTFGLAGEDVGHIADVLAAGANKSAADVADIGQALQQTGLVADQFGLTLDDTVGVLAMFAQAGLKGSDAGTSMKTMLAALTPNSAKAAETMESLGISMFDAAGNFVGIEAAAQELKDGLSGLTQEQRAAALETIFGSDAVRAATILYEGGAAGVDEWVTKVGESGYAAEVAATKMDNLAGDLEELRGSVETALIQGGSKATDALRLVTQSATDTVNAFSELPSWAQTAGVSLAGVGGGALTLLGAAAVTVPKIRELQTALQGMGSMGTFASNAISMAGKATLLATPLVIGAMIAWQDYAQTKAEAKARTDELVAAMKEEKDGLQGATSAAIAKKLADSDVGRILRDNAADYDVLTDGIRNQGDAIEELDNDMGLIISGTRSASEVFERAGIKSSAFTDELVRLIDTSDLSAGQIKDLINALDGESDRADDAKQKTRDLAAAEQEAGGAAEEAAEGTDTLGGALETLSDTAATGEDRLTAYRDAVDAVIGVHLSSFEAATQFGSAISGLTDELTNGERTLDEFTTEGQANREALSGAAQAAIDHAVAVGEESGSVEQANLVLGGHVAQLTDVMRQAGLTDEQIALMITQMGLTPENIATLIQLQNYDGATAALDAHQTNIASTPGQVSTHLTTPGASAAAAEVANLKAQLDRIPPERNVTITAAFRTVGQAFGFGNRWGGAYDAAGQPIIAAQSGFHWQQASVVTQPTMLFGERETGGEAYIPRRGNRDRSMSILKAAAGWYNADVVPRGMGGSDDRAMAMAMVAGFDRVAMAVQFSADRVIVAAASRQQELVSGPFRQMTRYLDWIRNGTETLIRMQQLGAQNVRWFEDLASIPRWQTFAKGGIAKARPGGVFANIAEAGQDEAVVPLDEFYGRMRAAVDPQQYAMWPGGWGPGVGPRVTVEVAPTVVVPDEFGPIQTARIARAVERKVDDSVRTAMTAAGL